tara:strand:- start:131 stop:403 length:273 start_codon:yes stop_codon:yes gene_type:complete
MADVDIIINNRNYRVSCKDGEEERISLLASRINDEVSALVDQIGQLGEARMILLAAIILLDRLDENENRVEITLNNLAKRLEKISEMTDK